MLIAAMGLAMLYWRLRKQYQLWRHGGDENWSIKAVVSDLLEAMLPPHHPYYEFPILLSDQELVERWFPEMKRAQRCLEKRAERMRRKYRLGSFWNWLWHEIKRENRYAEKD